MISKHIFRAYDIRGIVGQDFSIEEAEKIGKGVATYMVRASLQNNHSPASTSLSNSDSHNFSQDGYGISAKNHENNNLENKHNLNNGVSQACPMKKDKKLPITISVGRDGRLHSEEIQKNFIKGIISCGINVVNIGLSPSPLLNFSICFGNLDGGVNITASHNPKEFNGFKLQREHAHAIFGDEILEIAEIVEKEDFDLSEKKGEVSERDFSKEWINTLTDLVKIENFPKVVVDAGNGVAGKFVKEFFGALKTDVIPLYCEVDGNFPNHEANPEIEENLVDLKKSVRKNKADLGIAFDGDGDRVGIVDSEGNHYSADLLILLLARDLLSRNKGASIVYDLKATQLLKDEIETLGGMAVPCKTGHSFVEGKMQELGALLGGEVSGHLFFAENYYGFDDAFLAAAKILEIFTKGKKPFAEHFSSLPEIFVTPEIKVSVEESHKFVVMDKIVQHFAKKYPENSLTIDGVKIDYPDGSWGIVRASNTSPYLTLRFESKDQNRLKEIQKEFYDHLHNYEEISAIPKI